MMVRSVGVTHRTNNRAKASKRYYLTRSIGLCYWLLVTVCCCLSFPLKTGAVDCGASETTETVSSDAVLVDPLTESRRALSETTNTTSDDESGEEHDDEHAVHEVYAVLMPWFIQALGVVICFILTRYIHQLPYTAVLFILGTMMGVGANRLDNKDQLTDSILLWTSIDKEVLFCVFLPGLLFKDSFEINFYLFQSSFWQLILLAFPMVLGGTMLTALVGLYVFPYDWTWHLSLTFGSILAATDPVAVAALMNEVGAPPRLKMHIGGESLLNDGSAVVFYTVFSQLFFYDLGIPGGEDSTAMEAFILFLRMALGGVAVGIAYAIALVWMLYRLDRRYEGEETVLQVVATVTVAYLSFYTSEVVCGMSGVIAVVTCGILSKAFGAGLIADWEVMTSFWQILEHLLNTVLFALAGVVFGEVVSSADDRSWGPNDWGYLILLYVLLNIIRFVCMFGFYPFIVRIGLSTNIQETTFSSFAGLRGAVGIALALGLDQQVKSNTDDPVAIDYATRLFGMVGGVAFLTLVINGPLCGPLLKKLNLADSTTARKRIVENVEVALKRHMLDEFIHLMTDPRFYFVDFALVMHHCPLLRDLTAKEIQKAVRENRENVHPSQYKHPKLDHVLPYIRNSHIVQNQINSSQRDIFENPSTDSRRSDIYSDPSQDNDLMDGIAEEELGTSQQEKSVNEANVNPDLVRDMRLMFVELLRAAYQAQLRDGELDPREYRGYLQYMLLQSLEFAHESVNSGKPLGDWDAAQVVNPNLVDTASDWGRKLYSCCYADLAGYNEDEDEPPTKVGDAAHKEGGDAAHKEDGDAPKGGGVAAEEGGVAPKEGEAAKEGGVAPKEGEAAKTQRFLSIAVLQQKTNTLKTQQLRLEILMAFSFLDAHHEAEDRLTDKFGEQTAAEMKAAFDLVIKESKEQSKHAKAVLRSKNRKQLRHVISHYLCIILQNKAARYAKQLLDSGVLLQKEGRHVLEIIEERLQNIRACDLEKHPNSLDHTFEDDYSRREIRSNSLRKRQRQHSIL